MSRRSCIGIKPNGEPCKAHPMTEADSCFLHHPDHKDQVDAMRRARGQRAKKEAALIVAYDLKPLDTPDGIRRVLEVAREKALSLPEGAEQCRALTYIAQVATSVYKADSEKRVASLEAVEQQAQGNLLRFRAPEERR